MMRRLLTELRRSHSGADVEAALASLTVGVTDDVAIISRNAGTPLFGAPPRRASTVRIDPGVYAGTPTEGARVRLLDAAASLANTVNVHVPVVSDGTYRGRLAIDVPRRIVGALGIDTAEPGDRFDPRFAHAFFDDEAIVAEAERAGLRFVARRGPWVELERSAERRREPADAFTREVVRAIGLVREAERLRQADAPDRAVGIMRERGRSAPRRGHVARARLRRAIGWVDAAYAAYPGKGANCFRRVLLEIGLDAGAADETLVFGLDIGRTGHVAFKDTEDRTFDVAFEVPPERAERPSVEGR